MIAARVRSSDSIVSRPSRAAILFDREEVVMEMIVERPAAFDIRKA